VSTIYKVTADVGERTEVRWGGSMAEVREHKALLTERYDLKRKDLGHEEVEIFFNKKDVIAFLNEHCTAASPE
jgi:hypothetical protein